MNDKIITPSLDEEVFISTIHRALDQYEVEVFNGQEFPVKKPIGTAITCISQDVRNVKVQLIDQSKLLVGLKKRKAIQETFFGFWKNVGDYLRVKTFLKVVAAVGIIATSVIGIIQLISLL